MTRIELPSVVEESWRPASRAQGYEVSNLGRVRGVDRVVKYVDGRVFRYRSALLNPATNPVSGYQHVKLKGKSCYVHALVLEAFVGPAPAGLECRHLNGNPADNTLSNLRWGTPSENQRDRIRHGTHPQAAQVHCVRGHLLAQPNLSPASLRNGQRTCLACDRANSAVKKAKASSKHGPVDDMQEAADRRYAAIMSGRPSGGVAFSGGLVGLDRAWVIITRRRGFAHARAAVDGVAVCGRRLSQNVDSVHDWRQMKQCRNCARLIVAGVGWS